MRAFASGLNKPTCHQDDTCLLVLSPSACCNLTTLSYIPTTFGVGEGRHYAGYREYPCDIISSFITYFDDKPTHRTGALLFRFETDADDTQPAFEVLLVSASPQNDYGTLLIATTNHPENIHDRALKRPGRLDRIFIIPEMKNEADAEKMLRNYLGAEWRDEHRQVVPELVGKPGAFIREVALYALTAAYQDCDHLPLRILQNSLDMLEEQIEAKEDFLTAHKKGDMGLSPSQKRNRRRNGFGIDIDAEEINFNG